MKLTWEQAESMTGGNSSFFKLQDGETVRVRFLYNTVSEVEPIAVHNVNQNGNFATIDCGRIAGDPVENCKWCAAGNNPVSRVILLVYNVDTQEAQYWTRSARWVKDNLLPVFEEIQSGQRPISGQIFKIKRTGKTMNDTTYSVTIEINTPNDMKTRDSFGEIKSPYELNIIRPNDYEFPVATQNVQNNTFTSTRRTTDVF